MNNRDDEVRVRPGRIQHGNLSVKRPKSFVDEVMQAAKKAGHTGKSFRRSGAGKGRSTFGRGRRAAFALSVQAPDRRVVIMAHVVRHRALERHLAYLKREGAARDGDDAQLFGATSDTIDAKAFAKRCADDRHHFRYIVSPEDLAQMADLRGFTRELMNGAEKDLETKLDWVGVDHWNTDNPLQGG